MATPVQPLLRMSKKVLALVLVAAVVALYVKKR